MNETLVIAIIAAGVSLVTGLVASIPGIIALRQQKAKNIAEAKKIQSEADKTDKESKKTEADAAQVIQGMALELIEPYRKRILELDELVTKNQSELTERIEKLEKELEDTRQCLIEVAECAHALYDQVREQYGGTPECEPPDRKKLMEKFGKKVTTTRKKNTV